MTKPTVWCSFCSKSNVDETVDVIIKGPDHAGICGECIDICNQMVRCHAASKYEALCQTLGAKLVEVSTERTQP